MPVRVCVRSCPQCVLCVHLTGQRRRCLRPQESTATCELPAVCPTSTPALPAALPAAPGAITAIHLLRCVYHRYRRRCMRPRAVTANPSSSHASDPEFSTPLGLSVAAKLASCAGGLASFAPPPRGRAAAAAFLRSTRGCAGAFLRRPAATGGEGSASSSSSSSASKPKAFSSSSSSSSSDPSSSSFSSSSSSPPSSSLLPPLWRPAR